MQVVLCQYDIAWEDRDANFAKIEALLAGAPPAAGSLIVLPELCTCGFSMNLAAVAEGDDAPSERFLSDLAQRLQCGVMGSIARRNPDGRGRNEAVVFDADGRLLLRYAKRHPFTFAGEDRHYVHGGGMGTFAWDDSVVGPLICYDLRFPELARSLVRRGATVLVYMANFPLAREAHWLTLLAARAIENQAYVMGVNRCGRDPNVSYGGRSVVFDPKGACIADAGTGEAVVAVTLDLASLAAYRARFPALADIRDDDWLPPGAL